jgi:ribosome biogenesis GTPase / thiamine phosphate phosphatase
MTLLKQYGWNQYQSNTSIEINSEFSLGRVISIKGFKYHLITEKGELETELSGKLMYAHSEDELPKVGDWVYFLDYDNSGYIMETLPRMNEVSRKRPGNKTEKQVLAANIDYAMIVQGLDQNFNTMRLERYIVQMIACKIQPVVILNKADLVSNTEEIENEVKKLNRDCKVIFCSTYSGFGIERIRETILLPERTYIMIGSSGVGKSSLLNALSNEDVQQIGSVSNVNNKGKHTTTTRDLFLLTGGSLMIDTPGMREFGVTGNSEDSHDLFPAIQEFAVRCKFNDCLHLNESGCAVLAAVDKGNLDPKVYESYLKLKKEMRRFEVNTEDKKRMNKQFGKMTKEAKNHRKKYKF